MLAADTAPVPPDSAGAGARTDVAAEGAAPPRTEQEPPGQEPGQGPGQGPGQEPRDVPDDAGPAPQPAQQPPTPAAATADQLAAATDQLAAIDAQLSALTKAAEELSSKTAELARLRARDTELIDKLHQDNSRLRTGEIAAATLPLVTGLIRLHDLMVNLAGDDATSDASMLRSQLLQLLDTAAGITTAVPAAGDPFDARVHSGSGRVDTGDPQADGTVARTVRAGFVRQDGSVIRAAEVEVFRYTAAAAEGSGSGATAADPSTAQPADDEAPPDDPTPPRVSSAGTSADPADTPADPPTDVTADAPADLADDTYGPTHTTEQAPARQDQESNS